MVKRLIRWFNDFKTGYVRIRICEKCLVITRQNHWSKNDVERNYIKHTGAPLQTKIIYGHIWLCHPCFYSR